MLRRLLSLSLELSIFPTLSYADGHPFLLHVPQQDVPPVVQGQLFDDDWGHWKTASERLTASLLQNFPSGFDVSEMLHNLTAHGFSYLCHCAAAHTATPTMRCVLDARCRTLRAGRGCQVNKYCSSLWRKSKR
jgi:hypothetical protein